MGGRGPGENFVEAGVSVTTSAARRQTRCLRRAVRLQEKTRLIHGSWLRGRRSTWLFACGQDAPRTLVPQPSWTVHSLTLKLWHRLRRRCQIRGWTTNQAVHFFVGEMVLRPKSAYVWRPNKCVERLDYINCSPALRARFLGDRKVVLGRVPCFLVHFSRWAKLWNTWPL